MELQSNSHTSLNIPNQTQSYYPLSSSQRRLFVLHELNKNRKDYNLENVVEIEGNISKSTIEQIFQQIIDRHESLRTSFHYVDQGPVQIISEHIKINIEEIIPSVGNNSTNNAITEFNTPFDLAKAPLIKIGIINISETKKILVLFVHHIIFDATSMSLLMQEFLSIYNKIPLTPIKLQFKNYAVWENLRLETGNLESQRKFWLTQFAGELPILNLPTDFIRPATHSSSGDVLHFTIDKSLYKELQKISKESQSTLYIVLLSAYNILLSKYSGQDDIIIGSPTASRNHKDSSNTIGMFVNTIPLRNYPKSDKTFTGFLTEVRNNVLESLSNQDYQFDWLVSELNIERSLNHNPLFDVMFNLKNKDFEVINTSNLIFRQYNFRNISTTVDLYLIAEQVSEGIKFRIEYCTALFKPETIERMIVHFKNILETISKNPNVRLKDIDILADDEKQKILFGFNNTASEFLKEKTIIELFENQVNNTPDNIAVVFEDQKLTYRELNKQSNQVAAMLRRKGITPDMPVALMIDRSAEMIVGIFGILKAGGAYLPLAPEYPRERINIILQDSNTKILLTNKRLKEKIKFLNIEIAELDGCEINKEEYTNPEKINTPSNLAYIIYTSGTTGIPKGVMIENKSVINLVWALNRRIYNNYPGYLKIGLLAPIVFDASVKQIFTALLSGHALHIVPEDTRVDADKLLGFLQKNEIDIIDGTPVHINLLKESKNISQFVLPLKHLIIGGDILKKEDVLKFLQKLNEKTYVTITNIYGPTECTVDATAFEIISGEIENFETIPIGRPLPNTRLYIINNNNKLQPVGITGELCISGEGLARGYLNSPEITSEKFVDNPFEPGAKMYRTGDLARWLPDGNIEFTGRTDDQVKIRGFRIELAEIENRLLKHKDIKEVVVLPNENKDAEKFLCAYVVAERELNVTELRDFLSDNLPDYMIPSAFHQLEKLPLTPNGKIDKKALPRTIGKMSSGTEYEAPRNELEEKMVQVWQDVLGIETVGINDNFFNIGGDSIKAMKVVNQLQKNDINVYLNMLFENPTISSLSQYTINQQNKTKKPVSKENTVIDKSLDNSFPDINTNANNNEMITGDVPFSPNVVQYLIRPKTLQLSYHNVPILLKFHPSSFNIKAFEKAICEVIKHHDGLRSRIYKINDDWKQTILPYDDNFKIERIDLTDIPADKKKESIEELCSKIQKTCFQFKKNKPLIRCFWFDFGDTQSGRLFFIVHHFLCDGYSKVILANDLMNAYLRIINNKPVALPEKTSSMIEWNSQLLKYANEEMNNEEIKYWQSLPWNEIKDLPNDRKHEKDDTLDLACFTSEEQDIIIKLWDNAKLSNHERMILHNLQYSNNLTESETKNLFELELNNYKAIDLIFLAFHKAIIKWTGNNTTFFSLVNWFRQVIFPDINTNRTVGNIAGSSYYIINTGKYSDIHEQLAYISKLRTEQPNSGIGYTCLRYLSNNKNLREEFQAHPFHQITLNYIPQTDTTKQNDFQNIEIAEEDMGHNYSFELEPKDMVYFPVMVKDNKLSTFFMIDGARYLIPELTYPNLYYHPARAFILGKNFIEELRIIIIKLKKNS